MVKVKILSNNVGIVKSPEYRRMRKAIFRNTGDYALRIVEYGFINGKHQITSESTFNDDEFAAIGDFVHVMASNAYNNDQEIYEDEINNFKDLIIETY